MIRKLRIKFIAITMSSILAVIVVLMGMVNLLNYQKMVEHADMMLDMLVENDGNFPMHPDSKDFFEQRKMSPETPYETRFFIVHLNDQSEVEYTDTGKVAAVDTETAISYAKEALEKGNTKGFIDQYRYQQKTIDDGTLFVFLDCNRNIDSFQDFLLISCGVSFFGILLVLLLILFFSKRAMKPFSENYEKQKRFITDAGHEIKTPLAIINADIDVLEMDIGENEWLTDIQKQANRLSVLTKDLIYLARMEEENKNLQMIDLPFSDIVEETAQSFQALAISQNKTITINVQPMIMLYGDEKAFRQLVSILLDNAIKYSGKDGDISLNLEAAGRSVKLSVENTSEAISKENIEHLFDRFYRIDHSRNTLTGGYGIGLSIAQAIVQAHKGEIHASTKDEHSLKITAKFPGK